MPVPLARSASQALAPLTSDHRSLATLVHGLSRTTVSPGLGQPMPIRFLPLSAPAGRAKRGASLVPERVASTSTRGVVGSAPAADRGPHDLDPRFFRSLLGQRRASAAGGVVPRD